MSRATIAPLVAAFILYGAAIAQPESITVDFEELAQPDGSSVHVASRYAVDGYVFTSNVDRILSDQAVGTWGDSGSDTPVVFTGPKIDGPSVTASFTLPADLAPATCSFQGALVDLLSVRWEQLPQYHQFDNVVLASAAVPEPGTAWLLALGCSLLFARPRLRQRGADSRASLSPIPASTMTPTISTAHSDQRR